MMLPDSTVEGISITGMINKNLCLEQRKIIVPVKLYAVKSFVELSKQLLSKPGVQYMFSERYTLKTHCKVFLDGQRSSGGWNDNPTVSQSLNNTVSIRMQGSMSLKQIHGNCRKRPVDIIVTILLTKLLYLKEDACTYTSSCRWSRKMTNNVIIIIIIVAFIYIFLTCSISFL